MRQMVTPRSQAGALLIEILITIVIVIIGTLGLMQMQGRLQKSEMEAYQRTQAMILLNDMASRIEANRLAAADYVTTGRTPAFLGGLTSELTCSSLLPTPPTPPAPPSPTAHRDTDIAQWCAALQGAGEKLSTVNAGAMVGGRGCIEPYGTDRFLVTVVWQGLTPISAPPPATSDDPGVTCGANMYDVAGTDCVDDQCRRYVTTVVSLARLDLDT